MQSAIFYQDEILRFEKKNIWCFFFNFLWWRKKSLCGEIVEKLCWKCHEHMHRRVMDVECGIKFRVKTNKGLFIKPITTMVWCYFCCFVTPCFSIFYYHCHIVKFRLFLRSWKFRSDKNSIVYKIFHNKLWALKDSNAKTFEVKIPSGQKVRAQELSSCKSFLANNAPPCMYYNKKIIIWHQNHQSGSPPSPKNISKASASEEKDTECELTLPKEGSDDEISD